MSLDVAANLAAVRGKIAAAAKAASRDAAAIQLIAVSKTQPADQVEAMIAAGHEVFGENRVQEAQAKFPALTDRHRRLKLHLIGPLQTNKAREAVALFDVIESLDRPKLAEILAREMERAGKRPDCFIQVNIGEEAQKAGVMPADLDALVKLCRDTLKLPVIGLMGIPPLELEPSPYFALLRKMALRHGFSGLSMGMSADYELAVRLGATHVRVGTALFGPRRSAA